MRAGINIRLAVRADDPDCPHMHSSASLRLRLNRAAGGRGANQSLFPHDSPTKTPGRKYLDPDVADLPQLRLFGYFADPFFFGPEVHRPARLELGRPYLFGPETYPPAGASSRVTILEDVLGDNPKPEILVRAPGRANLIGEHTDYNLGYVLPVALELATYLAATRRSGVVHLRSLNEPGEVMIDLESPPERVDGWGRYVSAVVRALIDEGVPVHGLKGVIGSSVPLGAGLSSSAALEIALATALSPDLGAVQKAELCRRAEHDYVGVQVGIMDQLASAAAREDHALLIDCSDNSIKHVPIPGELSVLIVDSDTRRDLQSSAYNDRRGDCEEAARALSASSLRDVTLHELENGRDRMSTNAHRRAHHVITENERVLATVAALSAADFDAVGDLFAESHRSYAQDFEASLPEIDALVDIARRTPGVVAARLTGGGFGGCTVNLVHRAAAGEAAQTISSTYEDSLGKSTRWWLSEPAAGAGPVDLDGAQVLPGRT
ncbi:MAG: galactokinase [Actinomycetota bacterium]